MSYKKPKGPTQRQPYIKPELLLIALLQSEAVLAACKTRGALRAAGYRCDNHQGMCISRAQGS